MKTRKEDITLDDVLDLYQASCERSGMDVLADCIAEFPQFENELKEFSAYRKMVAKIPPSQYTEEEEKSLAGRGVSVVQNLLYDQRQKRDAAMVSDEAISGILDEIDRQHATIELVVEKTGLSEGIIWTLDRRQIRYETIPLKVIERIAFALGKLVSTIKRFLQGAVRIAPSHYKADKVPEAVRLYDFGEIVQMDPDLTGEQKEYWLSQARIDPEQDR